MHERYALPEASLHRLEEFLDGDSNEHGLDFVGTHGFLCAITVGPPLSADEWLDTLFEGEVPAALRDDLLAWQKSLHACLYHEQEPALPCALTPDLDGNELTDWCVGFMEGMFCQEEAWHADEADAIAEMTLPMVAISGLIDDPELSRIRRNPKLLNQLARQIPQVLTDLYLFFHAPRTHD